MKVFVVFLLLNGSVFTAKLPSFVTPCKRSDENLIECATNEGRKTLPQILNGVPELKLPNMKPLKLPEVKLDVGKNLKIKLNDLEIFGLENNDLKIFDINVNERKINVKIEFSRLNILSKYDINGRILVLPIIGNGPANITFVDPEFHFKSDLITTTKKSKQYLKMINPKISYTSKREYYVLDNLFNGDKRLGDQMNKFLDENWDEVSKEIGPAVTEVISAIVQIISNAFFNRITMDDLLPK
nr:protein takeout-like [Onthophagus taurus]